MMRCGTLWRSYNAIFGSGRVRWRANSLRAAFSAVCQRSRPDSVAMCRELSTRIAASSVATCAASSASSISVASGNALTAWWRQGRAGRRSRDRACGRIEAIACSFGAKPARRKKAYHRFDCLRCGCRLITVQPWFLACAGPLLLMPKACISSRVRQRRGADGDGCLEPVACISNASLLSKSWPQPAQMRGMGLRLAI